MASRLNYILLMFHTASRQTTYLLQVACIHKRPSDPHVELQQSAHCKYKMSCVTVTKSMNAATPGAL